MKQPTPPTKMAAAHRKPVHPTTMFLLGTASATAFIIFLFSLNYHRLSPVAAVACRTAANSTAVHPRLAATNATVEHGGAGDDEFAAMVRAAAMDDNTVIMTSVNEAWAAPGSLLDAFLESFTVGENITRFVNHIVVVAMDPKAFERCKEVHRYCYLLQQRRGVDLSAAKSYMTKDYLDLVWRKLKLQQRVLELGYHLLFTDVDVAWFRNPMEHITMAAHISTSSDFYFGDPDSLGNYPNTGFIFFKSCRKNIEVMRHWRRSRRRYPGEHDQFVFNAVKGELVARYGVRIKFLDTKSISGFCQLGRDLNAIATVHMTCCIGLDKKLHDLRRVIADWRRYAALPQWERQAGRAGWTFDGGVCIH